MDPPVAETIEAMRTGLMGVREDSPPEARTGVLPPTPPTHRRGHDESGENVHSTHPT